jgi:glyoxylase-like metal-dependent hydrolase (beta-lactamase superfamily II)
MEIVSGIHLVDGVRGANCYLIIGKSTVMVVDTGMPGNGRKIVDYITKIGKKPGDISFIVLTHADIDHSGSAAELKALSGGKLALHTADAAVLSGEAKGRKPRTPLFWLISKMMRLPPVKADVILKDSDMIGDYRVVHCPGHTGGSIALYHSPDIIFVGDALRSDKLGNPLPPSKMMSADMAQAVDSAKKIANLEFSVLLPGHGAPVTEEASHKVKSLLEKLCGSCQA